MGPAFAGTTAITFRTIDPPASHQVLRRPPDAHSDWVAARRRDVAQPSNIAIDAWEGEAPYVLDEVGAPEVAHLVEMIYPAGSGGWSVARDEIWRPGKVEEVK